MIERVLDVATRAMDSAILWQLGTLDVAPPERVEFPPVDAAEFWRESSVADPSAVRIAREIRLRHRGNVRVVDLEAPSVGPGSHPGSSKLMATAHLQRDPEAPVVLILHGFAIPTSLYEEGQCRALTKLGASAIRLDNPWHLRRRARGRRSGEGYMTGDPMRLLTSTRQAVEDAAALVAWARERSPHVAVLGVSLGGLIACMLAAQVELDQVVAVAPFCNPASTLVGNLPNNVRRKLGVSGDNFGAWGSSPAVAQVVLEAAMAPVVVRNMTTPVTPGDRITLVCPSNDLIVGPEPIIELAGLWGTDLWDMRRHGHISILRARGLEPRVLARLLTPPVASGAIAELAG